MKRPKIEMNAPVVVSFTVLSFLVLLFGYATHGASTTAYFTCTRTSFTDPMMYVRMFTYIFGHSDMTHYVGNFTSIILLGPILEEKYGSKALLVMILVTALVGGLANVLLTTAGLRGASGIVFLFIILCSCTSVKSGTIPVTMILVVAIYIGQEVMVGIATSDDISQLTHILGGICGILFGLFYKPGEKSA
ncbi:MAG: rhomboid family intramembrane serine protease [Oscillospiraceae bacterium]|nr:rhomboid family intramembrane serine protease [Oscillospiraceae bacterium]